MSCFVEGGTLPMSYFLPVRATYALRAAKGSFSGTILWDAEGLMIKIDINILKTNAKSS